MKKVLICSLLRRKLHLDEFLNNLSKLTWTNKQFYFLINDAEFDVSQQRFPENSEINVLNVNSIPDKRVFDVRKRIYYLLACLRNVLLLKFYFSDADYFLSIDSDIVIKQNAIETLIAQNKDFISCNISNDYNKGVYTNAMVKVKDKYKHLNKSEVRNLTECDVTGACFLLSRKVFEDNSFPLYNWHKLGEDISFCETVKVKKYTYPNLAIHKMK